MRVPPFLCDCFGNYFFVKTLRYYIIAFLNISKIKQNFINLLNFYVIIYREIFQFIFLNLKIIEVYHI